MNILVLVLSIVPFGFISFFSFLSCVSYVPLSFRFSQLLSHNCALYTRYASQIRFSHNSLVLIFCLVLSRHSSSLLYCLTPLSPSSPSICLHGCPIILFPFRLLSPSSHLTVLLSLPLSISVSHYILNLRPRPTVTHSSSDFFTFSHIPSFHSSSRPVCYIQMLSP